MKRRSAMTWVSVSESSLYSLQKFFTRVRQATDLSNNYSQSEVTGENIRLSTELFIFADRLVKTLKSVWTNTVDLWLTVQYNFQFDWRAEESDIAPIGSTKNLG